jgi:hypothetical protein
LRIKSIFERIAHNWPVKILAIAAAILLSQFYRNSTLEERYFSVPLKLMVDENYTPSTPYPHVARVSLRGPADEIFLILEDDIEVFIDLRERQNEGLYRAPVQFRKTGTASYVEPLEIRVEPAELTVALERKLRRSLAVFPNVVGFPEKGYELGQIFLNPERLDVEGPRSRISTLNTLITEPVDITGKTEDFFGRIAVEREDDLLNFPGGDIVEFTVKINESIILRTFEDIDIISLDLNPLLEIVSQETRGTVKVQGNLALLEEPGNIRITLDAGEIQQPGTYVIPTRVDVPLGVLVLEYEPREVTLVVSKYTEEAEQ